MLKLLAFLAAAVPIVLFVRAMFFRRPTRVSENMREFRQQVDRAVSIFLVIVACIVAIAFVRLAWAWWNTL
jgi:hypothetical protein